MGKENPYSTDVRVPLYISGPNIPQNKTLLHPTTHVDLSATIVELASATPSGPSLDGLSFAGVLAASFPHNRVLNSDDPPPYLWRNFSFSENAGGSTTWVQLRRPTQGVGDSSRTVFHWWCSNVSEVFDLDADPWQLSNLAGATPRGDSVATEALPLALALAQCAGLNCSFPTPLQTIPSNPLVCYKVNRTV